MPKAELITQAEYARRRGVDPTSVRDAVRAGRITLIDGKVDPAVADVQWERNTRRRGRGVDERPTRAPEPRGEGGYAAPPEGAPDYGLARARREQAEADLAELRLAELQKLLTRADEVESQRNRENAMVRESFMQLPARLVPLLAAASSPGEIERILREGIADTLQMLSEAA